MPKPTPDQITESLKTLAPSYLLPYCLHTFPGYDTPPHIRLLCSYLQKVERGEMTRLIVSLPPRHGKSELTSIRFPAWYLGRNPDHRVVVAAYGADLAVRFSKAVRSQIIDMRWPFPGIRLSTGSKSAENWDIMGHRGGFKAVGIGGPLTGHGADLMLIDDPIKDASEADSERVRDNTWDWYLRVARTRLQPSAKIVLTMTRWHEDDLAGRLLAQAAEGGEPWRELRLPACAEIDDPLKRAPGEALWPDRFPVEELEQHRRDSRTWNALYQQRPTAAEGALFKREWFHTYRSLEDGYMLNDETPVEARTLFVATFADLAISTRESADWTVLTTVGFAPGGQTLVLDVTRTRVESEGMYKTFQRIFNRYRPQGMYVEKVAFQAVITQTLRKLGMPIIELTPDRDKITRALPLATQMEAGRWFFREGAEWVPDLEHELLTFPLGKHDDQVDTLAYAACYADRYGGLLNPKAKRKKVRGWSA